MPFANSDGVKIYYELRGRGEPLVLLSGQASDHESWDDVAADYQDHHQLVLIDYRGTGKSDMPTSPPYSTRLFAQDVVAVLVHHLGFWSVNGCRVVYGIGDLRTGANFGFAYGTLTNHAEMGEEIFEVSMTESDDVIYRIRAASQPRAFLARIGYPYTRISQARFRRDSVAAMKRAIENH